MLKWYKKLYIGDNAKKNASSTIRKVNHKRVVFDVYLVTVASNPENLLEIISANQLLMAVPRKMCPLIVGIASGYAEAVELVQKIITETYQVQGNTDVRKYLKEKERNTVGD